MEQYILNLLKENKRIIIPDFGAFIIRPLNPPEIAFNGLLTFNDGILTEYVSKQTAISYVEAAAKVADYVEKLKTDLHQHNRLTFNEIGWIWTDDSGETQFTAWKDTRGTEAKSLKGLKDLDSILKDAELSVKSDDRNIRNLTDQIPFTLDETLKVVDVDASKDLLIQESVSSETDTRIIPDESFTLEESDKSGTTEQTSPEKTVTLLNEKPVDSKDLLQNKTFTEPVIQKTEQKDEKDTLLDEKIMASLSAIKAKSEGIDGSKPKNIPHELSPEDDWRRSEIKSTYSSKSIKGKKRRSWILPVSVIGVMIILAGSAWFIYPDQVNKILNSIHPLTEKTIIEEETGVKSDITSSENEADEQLPEQSTGQEQIADQEAASDYNEESIAADPETPVVSETNKAVDGKYYIVAGSFRSRTNAEKYVTTLQQKGFNAELFRILDNLYTVSFSSFSSRVQAEEELKRIRQTTEPEAWILLY